MVTFAAIRLQGQRFKPRPGQKFETKFLLCARLCSASGTTASGTRASPKPGNSTKGKAMDTNTGESPNTSASPNRGSEGTPTGAEMDGWTIDYNILQCGLMVQH